MINAVELRNTKTNKKVLIYHVRCQNVANPQRVYIKDKGFPLQSEKAGILELSRLVKNPFDRKDKTMYRSLIPAENYGIISNIEIAETNDDVEDYFNSKSEIAHAEYIGSNPLLYGKTALVKKSKHENCYLVQFDDIILDKNAKNIDECLAHNWHLRYKSHFRLLTGEDSGYYSQD